jgi:hypothetical protein
LSYRGTYVRRVASNGVRACGCGVGANGGGAWGVTNGGVIIGCDGAGGGDGGGGAGLTRGGAGRMLDCPR